MNIVVLDGYALNPGDLSWEPIEALGHLTVYDRTPESLIAERAAGAEIILTNKTPLSRDTLAQLPQARMVGVLATGYNIVDVDAARELGITVTNIPAYSTAAVAQLVFALLLEICHHVGDHSQSVHRGDWQNCPDFSYWTHPLMELQGKTLGIVGTGRIGRAVAAAGAAFGMQVLGHSRSAVPGQSEGGIGYVTLEELYRRSDVVTLHCPLTEATREMIDARALALMKPGAILINTSRGGLVHEQALADALGAGRLKAAGIDVVSVEPIRGDNPLLKAPNCLITPHIGWAPYEARQRLMGILEENIRRFQAGEPVNVVNP